MAGLLHVQSFVHGDVKPDHIMVRPDGELVLIDYDGMFTPSMKDIKSSTLGSRDLSHSLRISEDINEIMDDLL